MVRISPDLYKPSICCLQESLNSSNSRNYSYFSIKRKMAQYPQSCVKWETQHFLCPVPSRGSQTWEKSPCLIFLLPPNSLLHTSPPIPRIFPPWLSDLDPTWNQPFPSITHSTWRTNLPTELGCAEEGAQGIYLISQPSKQPKLKWAVKFLQVPEPLPPRRNACWILKLGPPGTLPRRPAPAPSGSPYEATLRRGQEHQC